MATLDIAKFRAQFPAFADAVAYPDPVIQLYWDTACQFIANDDSPCRTLNGDKLALALNYMTAHLLSVFSAPAGAAPGSGGSVGGSSGGFTTSASVGEVSVAKLAPPAQDGWQWWLAGSPYGQAIWAMLCALSVGGFAVGGLPEREAFRKAGGVF